MTTRQYAPIALEATYPAGTVMSQCDQCGSGADDSLVAEFPGRFYQVEIVGRVDDPYTENGYVCRGCFEESKERTFAIFLNDGEDILCTGIDDLERAMMEIATYLEHPDEYGRYAPFLITAQRDGEDVERIATIDMPRQQAG